MEKILREDETLRDGLQSEKKRFSLSEKIRFFEMPATTEVCDTA